jgi:programmed cell death 6-interacting protein
VRFFFWGFFFETNVLRLDPSIVNYFHKLESEDPYRSFTASDFEPVYVQALEKYIGDLEWVKQDAKQQKELVEYIKDVNEEFCDSRKTDSKIIERQNAIQSLEIAYNKYDEIKNNLDEGRKFYNSMLSNLTRLLAACKSFVYDRRIEGRNLEFEISQSKHASQSTGYEDTGLERSMQQLNVEERESFTPIQAPRPQTPNIWNPERDIRFSK